MDVGTKPKPIQRPSVLSLDEFIHEREGRPRDYVFDNFRAWARSHKWHEQRLSFANWSKLYREHALDRLNED